MMKIQMNKFKDMKSKPEISKSYNFIFASPLNNKKKVYYVRKMNEKESSTGEINKEIESYFYTPEKYFSPDSPIRLNKNPQLEDISLDLKSSKEKLRKNNLSNSVSVSKRITIVKEKIGNSKVDNSKYEIIDNKELNRIFNSYKDKINSQKNKSLFKSSSNNIPINILSPLKNQEKNILSQNRVNKKNKNLLKYLSQKLHKKEKDLVMNDPDNYLYKREIINRMENNPIYETEDRYKWTTSLRNINKLKGIRRTLVNFNTDRNPFWSYLIEKGPKDHQTWVRPGLDLDNRNFVKFLKKVKTNTDINEDNINSVKNLDEINVKGKNLLKLEFDREMNSKKKKILHKAFVENGKIVLNTDINKVFGKETFYKNYDKNLLYFSPSNSTRNRVVLSTYSN